MKKLRKYRTQQRTLFDSIEQVNEKLHKPMISLRVFLGIFLIALILVGSVWQKVKVSQLAQEIELLEKYKQELEENIGILKAKVLKLSDGKRVTKIAEDELKMVMPDSELLTLKEIFHESDLDD